MIDNWKEAFLIWLRQNKIKRIEQSVEPVQIRSMNGLQVYHMPSSSTLKFFDKDNKCVYEDVYGMSEAKLILDIFKLDKFPTFVEVDE